MPRLVRKPPAYQLHKASGQARVKIAGRDHWLGPHGSESSRLEYQRLIAEWRATNAVPVDGNLSPSRLPSLTVAELILVYWRHVQTYYVKGGRPTSEQDNIRQALRPVRDLYGHTLAGEFGPLALKAVRRAMIERGWCRNFINQQVCRIRGMFRWAASEQLVATSVLEALRTVAGLREGRTEAREKPPVAPVDDQVVQAILPHLQPVVAAMVRVQRLAGMRPQEVILMRGADLDRSDPESWIYRPSRHKVQHHRRERIIFLGPQSLAILTPFLESAGDGYIFSPARSEDARNSTKRENRRTPRWPSHCKRGRKVRPRVMPGEYYGKDSYRQAIQRACIRAGVPPFHPNQLRHTSVTDVRRIFGLDASRVWLGHQEVETSQIYAERDLEKAREISRLVG
jgi:integrase